MRLRVLGPMEVEDDDRPVALDPEVRRLVALMLVGDGERSTEWIADQLGWGPEAVQRALDAARLVFGERIQVSSLRGHRFRRFDGDELDVDRFVELCERALVLDLSGRREALEEALALWRGPVLAEFASESWASAFSSGVEQRRVSAVEDLGEVLIALGRTVEAVALLERHVAEQAHRERPVELLMRALAGSGRVPGALREFQRFRLMLREDLGLETSASLRRVEADLLGVFEPPRDQPLPSPEPSRLPTGTVTFLLTDIEGSTERWQRDEAAMAAALTQHDHVIRSAVESHGGVVFKHTGDGVDAVFTSAASAARAAIAAQAVLDLPVRMGMHTGEAQLRDRDYFGSTITRAARIMDAGHGGQILVSATAAAMLADVQLVDLGDHELKGFSSPERIHQIGAGAFPSLRTPRHLPGNLPETVNSFVGRVEERASLVAELASHRIVTLVGVGGAGKTRLAIEVSNELSTVQPDGCWLVELAQVVAAEAVPFAFMAGLGYSSPAGGAVVDDLVRRLVHRRLLIIVDNCEHVLGAAAAVIERVIARCPGVTVLATSREPLMVAGEQLVPVPPLDLADGVRLFADRARAELPDVELDGVQARAVEELCRRLDGLPLAIELAASRVRSFTPVEVAAQLDERFRVLVGGRRSRMERHQTMRGTLDWSYELCTPVERAVFDRVSVFPANFELAAARVVASGDGVTDLDVVDTIPRLVDRSLVQRITGPDGATRFRLLETMRSYGRDHLASQGTADQVRERHAHYVEACVRGVVDFGPDEDRHIDRMMEFRADALVALDWFIDRHDWHRGLNVVSPLSIVSTREGSEMARRLRLACEASGDHPACEDRIMVVDVVGRMTDPPEVTNERVWRVVRSAQPSVTSFDAFPAHVAFASIADHEVDEVVSTLNRFSAAPLSPRIAEYYGAASALAQFGHVEAAERVMEMFDADVAGLESAGARRISGQVRGWIAQQRGEWDGVIEQLTIARRPAAMTRPPNWFDVHVEFGLIHANAASGRPVNPVDLRRAWTWLHDEGLTILAARAAVTTGLVAELGGETDVARRFLAWALPMSRKRRADVELELRDVTLDGVPPETTDTFDSITALAVEFADRLTK